MAQTPYLALYRKWRPQVFSDVIGQEHITSVLKSEIKSGSVSHAYLFCGSRGTGKTTCAKILAKAVSCENSSDGDPCGKCPSCLAAENSFDITEMDAASNNGVDSIRELRERMYYPPSELKRRVYIIDEVHMLSQGAFNALLKTLEEPPSHVMFILATTELNKIPATILSRCKRFDFYRISPESIAKLLKKIAEAEKINLTDGALLLIARLAAGAMRDALSMLELFGRDKELIDEEGAAKILGVVGRGPVMKLLSAIAKKNTQGALEVVGEAYDASKDMGILCSETGESLRDLLLVKYTSKPEHFIEASNDVIHQLKEMAESFTRERLLYCIELIEETQNRLTRSSFSRRATFETAVIKLCDPLLSTLPEAIIDRLSAVEEKLQGDFTVQQKEKEFPKPNVVEKTTVAVEAPWEETKSEEPALEEKPAQKKAEKQETARTSMVAYAEFLEEVKKKDIVAFSMLVDGHAQLNESNVKLFVNSAAMFMLANAKSRDIIQTCLARVLGYTVEFEMTKMKEEKKEDLPDLNL